jgi:DNA modification methylase
VELAARNIRLHSRPGEVVWEPFGGSGTTLIASYGLDRICYAMELDAAYCDVICRRYQEHAGTKPVLESTGQPHDFTA